MCHFHRILDGQQIEEILYELLQMKFREKKENNYATVVPRIPWNKHGIFRNWQLKKIEHKAFNPPVRWG